MILYYLLADIDLDDLNFYHKEIEHMIVELYSFINDKGNSKKDKEAKIEYMFKKIKIYKTSNRIDQHQKILSSAC